MMLLLAVKTLCTAIASIHNTSLCFFYFIFFTFFYLQSIHIYFYYHIFIYLLSFIFFNCSRYTFSELLERVQCSDEQMRDALDKIPALHMGGK